MGYFNVGKQRIDIELCSHTCVCRTMVGHEDECEIQFAGFSKGHNKGVHWKQYFFMEKMAESWDGNVHDYQVTINRAEIVKNNIVLSKLAKLKHPNLMRVIDYCNCSVCVEYLPGLLLNSHKEKWLLGSRAGEKDYGEICSYDELKKVFLQVGDALQYLHENKICHTDPIDHNVLIMANGNAKLIDLLGSMPLEPRLLRLDNYVFLNRLVLPMLERIGEEIPRYIKDRVKLNGNYELKELLYDISKMN